MKRRDPSEEVSGKLPQEVSEKSPREVSGKLPQEVSGNSPRDPARDIAGDIATTSSRDLSRQSSIQPCTPTGTETPSATSRRAYEALAGFLRKKAGEATTERAKRTVDTVEVLERCERQALALTLIALAAEEELKRLLLERNHCEVKVVEERLVARIQSSGDEATRLLFTLSLLYLFEGKQQFKRVGE